MAGRGSQDPVAVALIQNFSSCVTPEFFQSVKLTGFLMKDVNDHIKIVQKHPVCTDLALSMPGADTPQAKPVFDGVRNGFNMHINRTGTYDKIITYRRDSFQLEYLNVKPFFG